MIQPNTLLKHCQQQLRHYQVQPKKSLGQNFLIQPNRVQKIIQKVKSLNFDTLIEIGPGWGALTHELKGFCSCSTHVKIKDGATLRGSFDEGKKLQPSLILIELDGIIAQHWQQQGFCVWPMDALKVDWQRVPQDTCVVGNLPYQIASRVLVDLSYKAPQVQHMVLMFQKEVAQNIMATPKSHKNYDYGLLSVVAQHAWHRQVLGDAGCGDFYPRPKVASRILYFKRKSSTLSIEYLNFLKQAFTQRRKQLVNNFVAAPLRYQSVSEFKNNLLDVLKKLNINPCVRAEDLSPLQLWQLFKEL